jgi:hypothetical protein
VIKRSRPGIDFLAQGQRVNFRGMWGNVGLLDSQTTFDNASAIRVCQPGPVAFQRANVSGGNRSEIKVRALPDFGLPRGFNILAAVPAAKISGNTSRALRARAKVSFAHSGFSRSAFRGLGLRFISFDLSFVGPAQTDHMHLVGTRCEYHHMQPILAQTQRLKPAFTVVLSKIFDYARADPLEPGRQFERDAAHQHVPLALRQKDILA